MSAPQLRSARFRAERQRRWRELEALLVRAEKEGVRALGPAELAQLPALYRAALASLQVARQIALDRNLVEWLENLCQRAYFVVYGTRHHFGEALRRFWGDIFRTTFRRLAGPIVLSAFFMLGGAVAAYFAVRADPERYFTFIDQGLAEGRTYATPADELRQGLYRFDDDEGMLSAFATFLFTHNSQVALLCFALGFALGIPTFLLLVQNGFALGAMTALFVDKGLGVDWFGWILPHGVTELFAIVLAAAGGLELGRAVAFPGERTRREELARRGRDAGVLAIGGVALLFFAALIEGFFRQLVHSVEVRYLVMAITTATWIVYFGWPRRGEAAA